MSRTEQAAPLDDPSPPRMPSRPRRTAVIEAAPATVVLLVPLVVVPVAALLAEVPTADDGRLPPWAVQAFGAEQVGASVAAATLPPPILALFGLLGLAAPSAGAIAGLGTVGRWAALGGFCLSGAALLGLLGLGLLLELVAPGQDGPAARLGLLAGLTCPLLAMEGCGCLLAASVAPSTEGDRGLGAYFPRQGR